MNWRWILVPVALSVFSPGPYPQLHAWQYHPDQDASREEIVDFYLQAYGDKSRLQQLTSFHMKWDITRASSPEESSRYYNRSTIARSEIAWTEERWAERGWIGPDRNPGPGLVDDGQQMFLTGSRGTSRLAEKARRGNHRLRFFEQGAIPIGYWPRIADDFQLAGQVTVDGNPAWKLQYRTRFDRLVLYIDQETGLAVRMERIVGQSEFEDTEEVQYCWTFLDYRVVDGIEVPHRIQVESNVIQPADWILTEVTFDQPVDESVFDLSPGRPADAEPERITPPELPRK